eukprot:11872629-Karenia_brevis.AAC.1
MMMMMMVLAAHIACESRHDGDDADDVDGNPEGSSMMMMIGLMIMVLAARIACKSREDDDDDDDVGGAGHANYIAYE